MSANLFELFQSRYQNSLEKTFLHCDDGSEYSYGDIDHLSAQFAQALLDCQVKVSERVVVQIDKSAAAVALYLACLRVGAVFVPLNTGYTEAEVAYFLADAQATLLVCKPEKLASLEVVARENNVDKVVALGNSSDQFWWAEVIEKSAHQGVTARDGDDLAAFLYTSGTTGRSKGAMLSHDNLASNALTLEQYWQFTGDDVLLHALPIFHVHGLFVALHCALLSSATVLFFSSFKSRQVLAALPNSTVMMGVPTFYTRLLAEPDFGPSHCQRCRLFISGSAPMTEQTHEQWIQRTGHKILERYGMTETGMITSNPYVGERIPGTVGFALPGVEVRVASEQGEILTSGDVGVLEVKGANVFKGYWKMPEKTAAEFRSDGFFITGDMAIMDEQGRVSIVGREKDLIISGGYNVYPKEIEIALDAIEGVDESAVIGLAHPDFGEAVAAVIVVDAQSTISEAELKLVLQTQLAKFKQPKAYYFVAELPRNAMGKVQKNILRNTYQDAFKV